MHPGANGFWPLQTSPKYHTADSREAHGVEVLAQLLPKSKVMGEERQDGAAEQTHAALQALSLAVSADALCKEACIDHAMDRLAYSMRDDEVGHIHHTAHCWDCHEGLAVAAEWASSYPSARA